MRVDLPAPVADAAAHSKALGGRILARMRDAGGQLSFMQYMEMCLYERGFGYYSAGARNFGAEGDFITAPEFSPLFSRCLARQIAEVLIGLGGGEILEAGAGSGVLAAQLLARLERENALPARYLILERSAELRDRQRQTIARAVEGYLDRVSWLDTLPADGFRGVVIANELLDALPVDRFMVDRDGVKEWYVVPAEEGFAWQCGAPTSPGLVERVASLQTTLGPFSQGYGSEIGFQAEAWVGTLATCLAQGVIFIIDYGYPRAEYYHPERGAGTLRCCYRHRSHDDPFFLPGLQDISAHVEFSGLAEAATEAGLEVVGLTTQAEFLLALGILDLALELQVGSPEFLRATAQIKQLTLPGEMGELVKVLALARGPVAALTGFSGRDLRSRL